MKIGIIGSGNIGGTAAKLFANAGHGVAISNSRGRVPYITCKFNWYKCYS
jgi:predicted dinucleotide-binding enzyme